MQPDCYRHKGLSEALGAVPRRDESVAERAKINAWLTISYDPLLKLQQYTNGGKVFV